VIGGVGGVYGLEGFEWEWRKWMEGRYLASMKVEGRSTVMAPP